MYWYTSKHRVIIMKSTDLCFLIIIENLVHEKTQKRFISKLF